MMDDECGSPLIVDAEEGHPFADLRRIPRAAILCRDARQQGRSGPVRSGSIRLGWLHGHRPMADPDELCGWVLPLLAQPGIVCSPIGRPIQSTADQVQVSRLRGVQHGGSLDPWDDPADG